MALFTGNRNAWDAPTDDSIREPLLADGDDGDDYDEEQPEEPQRAEPTQSGDQELSERPRIAASTPAEAAAARQANYAAEADEAHLDDDLQRQQGAFWSLGCLRRDAAVGCGRPTRDVS